MSRPSSALPSRLWRVVLDSSVLLGANRTLLVVAVTLRYCTGYRNTWIVSEFVRRRTEWIAERAARDRYDQRLPAWRFIGALT